MSGFIFFVLAVIFFFLWITKKPKKQDTLNNYAIDYNSKTYAQGYWDGVRAHDNGKVSIDTSQPITSEIRPVSVAAMVEPIVDQAELKAKRNLKNINTTLYIASFLLVAAAALFIGTALPEMVRFFGVCLIACLFYVVGLYLHKTNEKLKPAATAFVGTGLALLPFTGLAMYNFVLPDANMCWFFTSMLGLLAFIFAAVQLKSQVISYFAIAFVISLLTSSVANLSLGLIWYFVILIIFGSIMTFISILKPNLLPGYFAGPVQRSDKWIVPLTLIASLFMVTTLSTRDYWILTLVSAIYYGAVAAASKFGRSNALLITRLLGTLAVLIFVYDISLSWLLVGMSMSIIGVIQILISMIYLPEHVAGDSNNEIWLWLGFAMQIFAVFFVLTDNSWPIVVTGQLITMLMVSLGVAYYLSRAVITSFGTLSLMALPVIIGIKVINPAVDLIWLSMVFLAFYLIVLMIKSMPDTIKLHPSIKIFLNINFALFQVQSLLFTFGANAGVGFIVWLVAALAIYYLVYLERKPVLSVIGNATMLASVVWLLDFYDVPMDWRTIFLAAISFGLFYGGQLLLSSMAKKQYAKYLWWSAIISAGVMSFVGLFNSGTEMVVSAVFILILVSIAMVFEGWKQQKYSYIDLATIVATIGINRLLVVVMPELDNLIPIYLWSAVFIGLSYLYYRVGRRHPAKVRLIIALSIMSLFSGLIAIEAVASGDNETPYRLIFLVEHVLLIVAGLALSRRLFTIWGAVGVVLAILWLLSGYTFLLLAFAAFVLIGVAVFSLVKQSKK